MEDPFQAVAPVEGKASIVAQSHRQGKRDFLQFRAADPAPVSMTS
jgi:hypothetical protein